MSPSSGTSRAVVGSIDDRRIREAGLPAGHGRPVVELIVRVPAEHDVAEVEAGGQRREEFLPRHVFAADHAVDIGDADFHLGEAARLHHSAGVLGGLYLRGRP